VIAVCPCLHASLGSDSWSIVAGSRVRRTVAMYWRGISIAIEVITAINTLGLVGALPPLLHVVAKSICRAADRLFRPMIAASPH